MKLLPELSIGPVGKGNAFLALSRFQTGLIRDWGITSVLFVVGSSGKGCRLPKVGLVGSESTLKGLKICTGTVFPLVSCVNVWVKLPARSSAVGTLALIRFFPMFLCLSKSTRKKVFPLKMGPPRENPY